MTRALFTLAGVAAGLMLNAGEVLISHDILASKPTAEVQKGGTFSPQPDGGYRFTMTPETRDCWLRIPIDLKDLKLYDELAVSVRTENPKAGMVMELHASQPENAMVIKKNLYLSPETEEFVYPLHHAGCSIPPTNISFRMLNKQDNYHLPQSVMEKPVDFPLIRFNVTREGVERLRKTLDAAYDLSGYQPLGEKAMLAARNERDKLKTQSDSLIKQVLDGKCEESKRMAALDALYELAKSAPRQVEAAALAAADASVVAGWASGADKVFRARRFPGSFTAPARIGVARNETESAQIALYPKQDLANVTVSWSELVDEKGNTIGKDQLSISPVGYLKPERAAYITDLLGEWIPDPILTETGRIDIEKDHFQPYWVDVRAAEGQPAGVYRGNVEFKSNGKNILKMPLEVTVWNFTLPEKLTLPVVISADFLGGISNFPRMFSTDARAIAEWDAYMYSEEPEKLELSPEAKRLVDISFDTLELYRAHRIPYSDIYRGVGRVQPAWKRRLILEDDGLFCFGYDKSKEKIALLRPQVKGMRRDGDAGRGYIYGYDEITNRRAFDGMRRSYAEVKKHFPEVLRTAVALDYTYGELTDTLDTLDIWIVPPTEYLESIPAAERARSRGKKVWWYPCNWPFPPDANLLLESDATATRLIIGFMPWKFKVDGFLYYSSTFWIANRWKESVLGRWNTSGNVTLEQYGRDDSLNEFSILTTPENRKAGIRQWATLNQTEPVPVIAEAEIDVARMSSDPKRKFEIELRFNYQDKTSRSYRFPLDPGSRTPIQFSQTIMPEKPVRNVLFGLWIEDDNASLTFRNAALKQQGKSRFTRDRIGNAIVGGPLFPGFHLDVFGSNGDGSFFYPGLDRVLPSVRAKCLRDGREDYEYQVLLDRGIKAVGGGAVKFDGSAEWLEKAKQLRNVGDEICSGLDIYTRSGMELSAFRAKIGELLGQLPAEK